MALKEFNLDLSNLESGTDKINNGGSVVFDDTTYALGTDQATWKIDGVGSFTANGTANKVEFKADAGLQSGEYKVTVADGKVSLTGFDASDVTAGLKIGIDAVSVGGALKLGSGNDTIDLNIVSSAAVSVRGGRGADLFDLGDGSKDSKALVGDYSYTDGDVVSVNAITDYTLGNTGLFQTSTDGKTTVQATSSDSLYKVKVTAGTDNFDFATAANGSNVSVVLNEDAGVVNVSGADSAIVDLGRGNDTIYGADTTSLTLKVGRADGTMNKLDKALGADDTLALLNGDLSIVKVDGGNLKFGDTSIAGAVDNAGESKFNVSFDDGKTTGVAFVAHTGKINVDADAGLPDFYIGTGDSDSVVVAATGKDIVIDLSNDSRISGNVAAIDAKAVTGNAVLKGRAGVKTNIVAGVIAEGKVQEIYTGTGSDSIALQVSSGTAKVHLSDAKGNTDTVSGFNWSNDILVLDDVDALTVKTFGYTSNGLKLSTSEATVASALSADEQLNVQLAGADKEIKVAFYEASKKIKATKDTSVVLNVGDAENIGVDYTGAGFDSAFNVDLNDTSKYIGTFVSVNASGAGDAALVIGKDGVDNHLTIDGGSVAWGGANSNDSISISNVDVDGGSIVWTGAAGGQDTLTGYRSKDVIYAYDRETWTNEAIKSDVAYVDDNLVIKSADGSTLNLGDYDGGTLLLMGNKMEVTKVATSNAATIDYAADVNVYVAKQDNTELKLSNTVVAEGSSAVIDLAGVMGENKVYSENITKIDASASAGNFLLVGANVSGSQIQGGQTMNVLYGGGYADQTMVGTAAAADLFWFGANDGHDKITSFDATKDVVYLWSTTNIDDVKVSSINDSDATVVFDATGSTLDITGTSVAKTTFMVRDGADGYNCYTYDAENKAFVKKQV